jgi:hypothetical protein
MLNFILETLFWAMIFWVVMSYFGHRKQKEIDRQNNLIKEVMEKTFFIKSEQHGSTEYWFDAQNDSFLAQGKNISELIDHCKSRFPHHNFILTEDENRVLKLSGPEWKFVEVKIIV